MANDAIANLAKPGDIDEEPFLEERWDRVIAVMTDGVGEKVDRDDTGARPFSNADLRSSATRGSSSTMRIERPARLMPCMRHPRRG
jgi:hypothetical protein